MNKFKKYHVLASLTLTVMGVYLFIAPSSVSAVPQILGLRDKEPQETSCSQKQINEGFTNHDIFNYPCCYQKTDTPGNKCLHIAENAGLVPFRGRIEQPNGQPFNGVKIRLDIYRYKKSGENNCNQTPTSKTGYAQCCYKDPEIAEINICKQGQEYFTTTGNNYGEEGSYDFRSDNDGTKKENDFVCANELPDSDVLDSTTNQKKALYYAYYSLDTGANPNYQILKYPNQKITANFTETKVLGEESGLKCSRVQGPDKTEIINNVLQTTPTFIEKCTCPEGQQYNETTKKCGPPASEPPVAKCEGKCDWTKPDNGCPAAAGAEGGCYCVRQDDDNANTEGKCQPCPPGTTFNSTTNKCEPPGTCNVGCVENKDCNSEPQKQAGCTVCRADTTGNKTCQPPVACNDSCRVDRPEDCQGAAAKEGGTCSVCVPNQTGSNIGTCQAPPKLNCKCDSMEVSPIFIGSPINVTAYYKFYNGDLSGVKLPKMKFALYECTNQNSCNKKLEESEVTPQLVETSQSQVRYKGTWKFTPKEKLKVNTNYKIYLVSTPRRIPSSCSESIQASNYEQIMSLADSLIPTAHAQEETTSNTDTNPLQQVISWFAGLFGDTSNPIQNPQNTPDTDTTKEIQLTTLSPATVTNKGCYDYRFIIKQ